MAADDVREIRQHLDKTGCPVCSRVKKCQSDLLGGDSIADAPGLCNFHAWALAKSAPAASAAGVFLSALRQARGDDLCPFCSRLSEMEGQSLAALGRLLAQPKDREWMHHYGHLCLAHARKLEAIMDDQGKKTIREILQRTRSELEQELAKLLRVSGEPDPSGGGVLGRAAEFLALQRGLGNLNGVAGNRK